MRSRQSVAVFTLFVLLLWCNMAQSEPHRAAPTTAPSSRPTTVAAAERVHLLVHGHVQGVGFRDFTQSHARRLKLKGYVRNLRSGEVELEAEGESAAVRELVKIVSKGPSWSKVDSVKEQPVTKELLGTFEIRESR